MTAAVTNKNEPEVRAKSRRFWWTKGHPL